MRKNLLYGNLYKANMHCHSTVSDGRLTPEEIKKIYLEKGYSIVAYTDHDVLIRHNDLTDDNFLALNAYEIGMTEDGNGDGNFLTKKTIHVGLIALDENIDKAVCLCIDKWMGENVKNYYRTHPEIIDKEMDFERNYTPECVNKVIKRGKDNGFFVTYNHPAWSCENYEQYSKYEGMDALEIYNGDVISGHNDISPAVYEDLLRQGKYIGCTGGDDNHNVTPLDSPKSGSFVAWTYINADELTYKSVAKALKDGKYYASMGPVIKELYVEDGVMHIECEPCRSIVFNTGIRVAKSEYYGRGNLVTKAEFRVGEDFGYVRVTLTDDNGYTAHTRGYSVKELLS